VIRPSVTLTMVRLPLLVTFVLLAAYVGPASEHAPEFTVGYSQVPHFANPNRSISDQARVLNQRLAESLRQKNPNLCSVTPSVHRSFK
jgi:hypothetical protein